MLLGKKIGPFTIDKELGAGAMGAVYRGHNVETGQRVAIKIVAPGLLTNETALKRFTRESAILRQLKHPNIVRLVLAGKVGTTPFYAMEYVEGESLDRVMARRGRISWEEVVIYGRQLCEALKHAHDKGIIHRDLKPSNVMALRVEGEDVLKLTDFGIAKDVDETALTSANCTVGTAAYMSPEQCRGERNLTPKSDLYSLGIMFYELVTGTKPFKADSPMDMFMLHVNGKFERPRRLVLDIPVWLDNLICQLLEKKPEQRPYDAAAVAEALDRIKEKVEAQQSAGADVAKARAIDRPDLDDEDREAARTLAGKKKKKKKAKPFYQQRWFQAVLYSALLVAIVAVFYVVFLKAPSAETLYAAAQEVIKDGDLEKKVEARRTGPIAQFLKYYPKDARARKVQTWADEIDREKVESEVVDRYRKDVKSGLDADEESARTAIQQEEEGHPEQARPVWQSFLKFEGSADADKNGYALLAKARIKSLDKLKDEDARLSAHVTKDGPLPAFKAANDYEAKAAAALQAELIDPGKKGLAAWKELQKEWKRDDPEQRFWFLLAAKHVRELQPAPPPKKGASLRPLSAPTA